MQRRDRDAERGQVQTQLDALLACIANDEAQLHPVQANLMNLQVRPSISSSDTVGFYECQCSRMVWDEATLHDICSLACSKLLCHASHMPCPTLGKVFPYTVRDSMTTAPSSHKWFTPTSLKGW